MHLPSRTSMLFLLGLILACYIILSWIAGLRTPENATFRDWFELIGSIIIVAFILGYSILQRFGSPLPSRTSMLILLYFILACYIILSWIAGLRTSENASTRERLEPIASIIIVAFVLRYFILKRFRSSTPS